MLIYLSQQYLITIGTAVEQEAQMQYYEREYPGLLETIKRNYWHNTTGTQQKFVIVRTMMNRADDVLNWNTWSNPTGLSLVHGYLMLFVRQVDGFNHIGLMKAGKRNK